MEAKEDVARWAAGELPLDVWALDMNWRNTSDQQDRYYDHPNTALFANFTEWFAFLKAKKLRTYFNDRTLRPVLRPSTRTPLPLRTQHPPATRTPALHR